QAPFPGGSLMQKLLHHQNSEPEAIESFREDVPVEASMIVKRMMSKTPERRFQTPAGVALALMPFMRQPALMQAPQPTRRPGARSASAVAQATPMPANVGELRALHGMRRTGEPGRRNDNDAASGR